MPTSRDWLEMEKQQVHFGPFILALYALSHTIHVGFIYLHWVDFYGKCR